MADVRKRLSWGLAASLGGAIALALLIRPVAGPLRATVPWVGPLMALLVALLLLLSIVQAVALLLLARHRSRSARGEHAGSRAPPRP
jgi:hypothetical protein